MHTAQIISCDFCHLFSMETIMHTDLIEVFVAIDAAAIAKSPGPNSSASNPPTVDPSHISIAGSGQSAKDNNLFFNFADQVNWRASAIGLGYACEIYDFVDTDEVITPPQLASFNGTTLTPNPENPSEPTANRNIKLWHWRSLAASKGQANCGIRFVIFGGEGQKIGYYQCNISITTS
ncbi:AidA/PixA family protein [Burkholderia cenocepacia]|uniref:AidA/PixA family protein n=1 Tax=Burkholderia cenocepacia TaxID=95486 RepID=UPI002AB19A96|nr:AidA/PixA family protein [Burkholderia cenocepacia]